MQAPKLEPVAAMKSDGGDPAAVSKAKAPTGKDDGSVPETQFDASKKKAWWDRPTSRQEARCAPQLIAADELSLLGGTNHSSFPLPACWSVREDICWTLPVSAVA